MPRDRAAVALRRDEQLATALQRLTRRQLDTDRRRILEDGDTHRVSVDDWALTLGAVWAAVGQAVFPDTLEELAGESTTSAPRLQPRKQLDVRPRLVALISDIIERGQPAEQLAVFIEESAAGVIRSLDRSVESVLAAAGRPSDLQVVRATLQRLFTTDFVSDFSQRVALEEVLQASAAFEYQAAIEARDRTGRDYMQHWRNQGDERVRDTHTGVASVALGELFSVGDALLRFPRDPAGPAREVKRCRCWCERKRV